MPLWHGFSRALPPKRGVRGISFLSSYSSCSSLAHWLDLCSLSLLRQNRNQEHGTTHEMITNVSTYSAKISLMTKDQCDQELRSLRSWVLDTYRVEQATPNAPRDPALWSRRNTLLNIVDDAIYDLPECETPESREALFNSVKEKLTPHLSE